MIGQYRVRRKYHEIRLEKKENIIIKGKDEFKKECIHPLNFSTYDEFQIKSPYLTAKFFPMDFHYTIFFTQNEIDFIILTFFKR